MLWVLIKMPRPGDSNEYPQHGEAILMSTRNMFLWRTDENYPSIIKSSNTLLIWSSEVNHFVGFVVRRLIA